MTTPPATPAADLPPPDVGIVVIGRNEGERLVRCLASLGSAVHRTVYVDSGSTDGSADHARAVGADVVDLDLSVPFTAARARNEGFERLLERQPELQFVQFVDGDCEVEVGWLGTARAALANAGLAAVFGRRRERFRERTVYNLVSDLEWDVPVGEVDSCGGDVMMRVAALREVGGYDPSLIAGEEPDLCRRLRERGWRIRRIDAPMTIHDAALLRLGQWWKRAVRAGYVEGEGLTRLGLRYPRLHAALSMLFWTFGLALAFLGMLVLELVAGVPWPLAVVAVVLAFGVGHWVLWLRIVRRVESRWGRRAGGWYACFCLLAKWPGAQGMLTYWWRRLRRDPLRLIEYKDAVGVSAVATGGAVGPGGLAVPSHALGVVVIGRNEGERLLRCLASLGEVRSRTVYVDSGSTDGSSEAARNAGVQVVELDVRSPFTAARARNAGWRRAAELWPELSFVQFVDGDCELEPGWLDVGLPALAGRGRIAAVFGRCREREREASIYNRLCDLEWDVPAGFVEACGGNALMRLDALRSVEGFDARLIAGEEPDLCYRLAGLGWKVLSLPVPMARHDAAIRRFGQWWRRASRAGYVGAEGLARHGRAYPRVRHSLGVVLWATLPLLVAGLAAGAWSLGVDGGLLVGLAVGVVAASYLLLWLRILQTVARRWSIRDAATYATFCVLAKWPGLQGMLTYWWRARRGRRGALIEYKDPLPPTSAAG